MSNPNFISKKTTPKGVASFCNLDKPDENGKFVAKILFKKDDAEFQEWAKARVAEARAYCSEHGLDPALAQKWFKKVGSGTGSLTKHVEKYGFDADDFVITARSKNPVPLVDANKEKCGSPWGGDTIRLVVTMSGYTYAGNRGITLYLGGCQVVETNRPSFDEQTVAMFDVEGGGEEAVTADSSMFDGLDDEG
jgi:hypothetical protein